MDFGANKPIYLHIYDIVAERIISGHWHEGDRVPSVRELAAELQVNPNTVMRAYDALQQGGLIAPTRGIGYFVAEGAAARALEESRRDFVENELTQLFRRMDALGFAPEEITKLYSNYKTNSKNENK